MPEKTRVALGDKVRDPITGLEGVAICISQWLHGCRRITVQPAELKDGRPVDPSSFDEPQLEILAARTIATTGDTGGPRPEPTRPNTPAR